MKVRIPILALTAWVAFAEPEQHGTSTTKSSTGTHNEFFQCDLYREKLFAAKMDTCMAEFNVQTEKLKMQQTIYESKANAQQTIYESKANDKMKELFSDFQKHMDARFDGLHARFDDIKVELVDFRKHMDARFVDSKVELVDFRKHMDARFVDFKVELVDFRKHMHERFDETGEQMAFYFSVTAAIYFGLFLLMLVIPSSHGVPFGDYVWMTYKHMRDSHDLHEIMGIIALLVVPTLTMYALPRGYHVAMLFAMIIVIDCVIQIWQRKKYPPQQQPLPPNLLPAHGAQQQQQQPPPPPQPPVQGHQQAQGAQQQQQPPPLPPLPPLQGHQQQGSNP
eukprot:CAMPEP_0113468668 /NCGR_PEP_ID=MMETSP0014_2-20120614/15480_1 /TAXON_ID=2857 /ORGANISM="Nitzschia sp." /LENGTH=335 /DNA_ID=CAMNT_0000361077 /DNA_START=43 /DNA_END=1050 /DNA_ORIENTATION=+ /assembly_acc=CAM_ASM_000159